MCPIPIARTSCRVPPLHTTALVAKAKDVLGIHRKKGARARTGHIRGSPCTILAYRALQKALEDRGIEPLSTELEYICNTASELPEDQAKEVLEVIDKLEQDDDVQKVYHTLA